MIERVRPAGEADLPELVRLAGAARAESIAKAMMQGIGCSGGAALRSAHGNPAIGLLIGIAAEQARFAKLYAACRCDVMAGHFVPAPSLFSSLGGFTRRGSGFRLPDHLPNLYSAGRAIGDESRYILDRRYARKFPGNPLARPGLLLNPWDKRSTEIGRAHV